MILHDHVLSAEGYSVRLMLALIGAPHDHRVTDILAEPRPPDPVPRLVDGDRTIDDPAGALVHLAATRAPDWLPDSDDVRAWLAFGMVDLAPVRRLREARLFGRPARDGDERAARRAFRQLDDRLIEETLAGRGFVAGDRPTVADVACFPAVALADDAGIPLDRFHGLVRYIDRMAALPGFVPMPGVLVLADPPGG